MKWDSASKRKATASLTDEPVRWQNEITWYARDVASRQQRSHPTSLNNMGMYKLLNSWLSDLICTRAQPSALAWPQTQRLASLPAANRRLHHFLPSSTPRLPLPVPSPQFSTLISSSRSPPPSPPAPSHSYVSAAQLLAVPIQTQVSSAFEKTFNAFPRYAQENRKVGRT